MTKSLTVPVLGLLLISTVISAKRSPEVVEIEKVVVEKSCSEPFTKQALIEEIKNLNFKYPDVVIAQAKLETGNFTSDIFLENNNLFGMKKAYSRINTATGVNKGHATYDCWRDSLLDYALYVSRYVRADNQDELLAHLGKYYAQDPIYESKVRRVTASASYFD